MSYIPKAICVKCKVDYKVDKNGVVVHTLTADGQYYYSIESDRWICPDCGHMILVGFAPQPFSRNFQTNGEIPYDPKREELVVRL